MAKTEIEERAWSDPRLKMLRSQTGLRQYEAIGLLAVLWHDSQELLRTHATAQEIDSWLELPTDTADQIRAALVVCAYLEIDACGAYAIKGNRRRVDKNKYMKKAARDAANARWKKVAHTGKSSTGAKPNTGKPPIVPSNIEELAGMRSACDPHKKTSSKSMRTQCDPQLAASDMRPAAKILDIEILDKEIREDIIAKAITTPASGAAKVSSPKKASSELAKHKEAENGKTNIFIAAYCDAYRTRYPDAPTIAGRAAGTAKRIVKDIGLDAAVAMVQTYIAMDDRWFLTKTHDLETFESNYNKVKNFMKSGQLVTAADTATAERRTGNVQAAQAYLEWNEGRA